ncbi:MAG: hypothetical protein KA419_20530 [Acidobacteria bacterium]|nr:hypothetical protein [Acidobacteriota bacterium]
MNANDARLIPQEEVFGPVIHACTRAQALADGVLVDVTETAREAGFRFPVALTAAAWSDCVAWGREGAKVHQDEAGRLWDVLWMARCAAARAMAGEREVEVKLHRVPRGRSTPRPAILKMVIGPGDEREPVITLMMPDED